MEQFLTQNNNEVDAVVASNDGMAGGVVEALRAQGRVHPTVRVEPLPENACVCAGSIAGPPVPVPTLFGIYLRHGGYILGPPALDREFGTIDYLTYITVDQSHLTTFGGRRR